MSKPGHRLLDGLTKMNELATPGALRDLSGEKDYTPAAMKYLMTVLQFVDGQSLTSRDNRELETLATTLDLIADGRVAEAGDAVMQRFKAIESGVKDGTWELAQHQELVPSRHLGLTSQAERRRCAKQSVQQRQVDTVLRHPGG